MVFIKLPFHRKRPLSVLDLPFTQYDPSTHLPESITIGGKEVVPYMSVQDLKDHLTLLAAYYALRHSVSNFPRYIGRQAREYQRWAQVVLPRSESRRTSSPRQSGSYPSTSRNSPIPILERIGESSRTQSLPAPARVASPEPLDPARAEEEQDNDEVSDPSEILESELPTLGVLMCWHAHMLNPRLYSEECEGAYRALRGKRFPLRQAAEAIRNHTLPDEVDFESEEFSFVYRTSKWEPPDIAAAVQRHMRFVNNVQKLGWLEEDVFEKDITPLRRGNVRYHAWLDLMHSTENRYFLVPTMDIDLAWHTHQLKGLGYQEDVEDVLGWFLGHDDQASDNKLGGGLEKTGKLWKRRFGYTYTF